MSFEGTIKYLLPQIILLIVLVMIVFSFIPPLFEWGINLIGNNRYGNSLFNLRYARKSLILLLPLIFFISFVSLESRPKGRFWYRVIQLLMVVVIAFSTLFVTTP